MWVGGSLSLFGRKQSLHISKWWWWWSGQERSKLTCSCDCLLMHIDNNNNICLKSLSSLFALICTINQCLLIYCSENCLKWFFLCGIEFLLVKLNDNCFKFQGKNCNFDFIRIFSHFSITWGIFIRFYEHPSSLWGEWVEMTTNWR